MDKQKIKIEKQPIWESTRDKDCFCEGRSWFWDLYYKIQTQLSERRCEL